VLIEKLEGGMEFGIGNRTEHIMDMEATKHATTGALPPDLSTQSVNSLFIVTGNSEYTRGHSLWCCPFIMADCDRRSGQLAVACDGKLPAIQSQSNS
jgi:hypothetical protein